MRHVDVQLAGGRSSSRAPVAPGQRLGWGKTVGIGGPARGRDVRRDVRLPGRHGPDPNLAILFSGICTIPFLLITSNKVPSYLGTSASFVAGVAAIRAQGGDSADVTGAILVSGVVLFLVGVLVHSRRQRDDPQVLPPAVTGAVVMLIGFNLAPWSRASTGPRTSGSRC